MMNVNWGRLRTRLKLREVAGLLTLLVWTLISPHSASAQTVPVGASPSDHRRIEENDPSVVYTGVWYPQYRSDLSGGSIVESPYSTGTAILTFLGTGVSWIGFKATWGGIAQVYLDGTLRATVDTYAPAEQAQVVMYAIGGLPAGLHTVMIKVTGTWSSSACCSWVVVDAFDVIP